MLGTSVSYCSTQDVRVLKERYFLPGVRAHYMQYAAPNTWNRSTNFSFFGLCEAIVLCNSTNMRGNETILILSNYNLNIQFSLIWNNILFGTYNLGLFCFLAVQKKRRFKCMNTKELQKRIKKKQQAKIRLDLCSAAGWVQNALNKIPYCEALGYCKSSHICWTNSRYELQIDYVRVDIRCKC